MLGNLSMNPQLLNTMPYTATQWIQWIMLGITALSAGFLLLLGVCYWLTRKYEIKEIMWHEYLMAAGVIYALAFFMLPAVWTFMVGTALNLGMLLLAQYFFPGYEVAPIP